MKMLNDLINQVANNNNLFVELLLNFYLDSDVTERQKIEQILLGIGRDTDTVGETLLNIKTSEGDNLPIKVVA
jgi:hypothetical protein